MDRIIRPIVNKRLIQTVLNTTTTTTPRYFSNYSWSSLSSTSLLLVGHHHNQNVTFNNNKDINVITRTYASNNNNNNNKDVKSTTTDNAAAAPKLAQSKPMNRRERRSMEQKLNRSLNNLIAPGVVSPRYDVPDHIPKPYYAMGQEIKEFAMDDDIPINTAEDIAAMRQSCHLARDILQYAGQLVRVGVTTDEIDRQVFAEIVRRGAYPSPLGYKNFPKSICTSVNEVLCHGIPDSRPLADGDIINIDVTVFYKGYHGDTSATFTVGQIDKAASKLLEVTKMALEAGINAVKPGKPFSDIGQSIQAVAHKHSYSIPIEFVAHGIGKEFHAPPFIFQCVNELDYVIQKDMIFTIEPILVEGTQPYTEWKMWDDEWTITSKNGGWAAQFEHTVLVTDDGAEILTK
ncbi:hypothetical protein SAMD00019534_009900 [Acytostelium subglobosum LB1]|uniref:hypothetical protein n=1 Tax=Acytostelium subglobosum LB1 TaxID=1410327 RepID=UPI0006450359|nr:hypothetical protein SAMD00019534_009900 [Acytostelium subglobosum LB1]GAM17815.1 hypothetical protein SAMD00019534_009900 [Acytostelium subglobosum LB1]|eukprot:XP_012758411.1 hypothetical protein SAMD00019534_009900 [Acytostelium subglobosum LB1]